MPDFSSRRTLALTSEGDLKLNELNRFEWLEGVDAVTQEMKVTLSTVKGEDPFDAQHGVDVFSVSQGGDDVLRSVLSDALEEEHGDDLQQIDDIMIDHDTNRRADVSIQVTLADDDNTQVEFNV